MDRSPSLFQTMWDGSSLNLVRRRVLDWVLISGHGAEDRARLSDGRSRSITPRSLILPSGSRLFLLGCYQGRAKIKREWAETTGVEITRVYGCAGETESVLSTLFLLNLLESGFQSVAYWFERWIEANDYLRSWFPRMRETYRRNRMDFVDSLEQIEEGVDLDPVRDFISVGKRYPAFLSELG